MTWRIFILGPKQLYVDIENKPTHHLRISCKYAYKNIASSLDICMLSNDIYDYHNVSQGKVTIPNVNDGEECVLTDVSKDPITSSMFKILKFVKVSKLFIIPLSNTLQHFYDRPVTFFAICLLLFV